MNKTQLKEYNKLLSQLNNKRKELEEIKKQNYEVNKALQKEVIALIIKHLTEQNPIFEFELNQNTRPVSDNYIDPELYRGSLNLERYTQTHNGDELFFPLEQVSNIGNNTLENYRVLLDLRLNRYELKEKVRFIPEDNVLKEIRLLEEQLRPYEEVLQKEKELKTSLDKLNALK